jgi:hypothetical protein
MSANPPDHTSADIVGGRRHVPLRVEAMCLPVVLAALLLVLWDSILAIWLQQFPLTGTDGSAVFVQGIAVGMACSQVGFIAAWLVLSNGSYRAWTAGLLAICWLVPCLMPFHALHINGMSWETAAIVAGAVFTGLSTMRLAGFQLLLVAGDATSVLTPRRRQFSLGQIMGAVTFVAVVLAVLGYPRRPIATGWPPSVSLAVGMGVCTLVSVVAFLGSFRPAIGIVLPIVAAATLGLLEVLRLPEGPATVWRAGIATHALITCGGLIVARAAGLRWLRYRPEWLEKSLGRSIASVTSKRSYGFSTSTTAAG